MKHLFYTFLSGLLFISNILPSNAQDYPPNPLEKEGYRLIFHDEFDGKEFNTDKWIPEYLPSWPKDRSVCTPTYEMKNGIIRLIIDKNSKNEFDNGMYISGFMSASRTGLHHYDPKKKVLHQIKTEATQINQYGYYEMRAKMQDGGGVHCAWWLIGFEDDPNQSCEIDIFEILGTDVNRIWATVHSWKDSTIQYHTEHPWFANKKLAELKGVALTIPNESILINTLILQEAKESSAVENIITTHDELYKADAELRSFAASASTKEVVMYADALKRGFDLIRKIRL